MSWDEWERLKTDAADRGSARMQLNQAPDPVGVGGERLKSSKKAWTTAGEDTKELQSGVGKALGKLEAGQAGLGDTARCQTAAAQKELYDSWKAYLDKVGTRCGELGSIMQSSGIDLAKSDGAVKAELDKLKPKYQDTDPVGGQPKGR
ncbi:hypothetical protein ACH4JS_10460 [Streptomyces sp. NPDC017638]|uniref:hypothetical protein n=1 Tax=Streptomyces sp. NPDC017638 TaxID=3365004 RepID=UPI0037AB13CA